MGGRGRPENCSCNDMGVWGHFENWWRMEFDLEDASGCQAVSLDRQDQESSTYRHILRIVQASFRKRAVEDQRCSHRSKPRTLCQEIEMEVERDFQ